MEPKVSRGLVHGLVSLGAAAAMVMNAPFNSPAPPIPCTARPEMSMFEEVAVAQRTEPKQNIAMNVM